MHREPVKDVWILHVATNTVRNRSLPRTLEQVAVVDVVEAVDAFRLILSRDGMALANRQLGVTLAYAVHQHERSLAEGEFIPRPIIADLLVHATDEIRQRHIVLELVDGVVLVHRANTLAEFYKKSRRYLPVEHQRLALVPSYVANVKVRKTITLKIWLHIFSDNINSKRKMLF